MANIGTNIAEAISFLQAGDVIGMPTETVYGLAGNALDPDAVLRIFSTKNRPQFNPLIVHGSSVEQITNWVRDFPEPARKLAEHFWPGPLTLLLPRSNAIHDLLTAGSDRVAVRVPNHPITQKLLSQLDFPLAAPSANPFGYISPTTAQHVADQLDDAVPYILDGGPCTVGLESTIVGFAPDGTPEVLRFGGISREELEAVVGPVQKVAPVSAQPEAPGRLSSHYAPTTPFVLGKIPDLLQQYSVEKIGILSFQTAYTTAVSEHQVILSEAGNLQEAARNLFGAMRHLDQLGLDIIVAEHVPTHGLGPAINDRLNRAAAAH